jgi:hypothetical protein
MKVAKGAALFPASIFPRAGALAALNADKPAPQKRPRTQGPERPSGKERKRSPKKNRAEGIITIDEFFMRSSNGRVTACERVEKADKLLKSPSGGVKRARSFPACQIHTPDR